MTTPLRLLIVEDWPDDAELMVLALRKGGLDPVWERVETADALKAALAAGGWNAVLSDYSLPEFWAVDALEIVRATDPDVPFIVVSGTVGEDVAVGMLRAGANDYILKQSLIRLAPALERELREAENRRNKKRADAALRTSEARYRRLFEAAQDGILIVDAATRKVFDVNPFLADLLGYTREELVGKELWEIGLFRDIEANKAAFGTLQAVGHIRYDDLPLQTRDGGQIAVEFVSNTYQVGDDRVIQCNIRDVTVKKRAEEGLRLFRTLIDSTSDGIEVIDPQTGRFLDVNEQTCVAHGYTRDEFLRMGVPDVDPLIKTWGASAAEGRYEGTRLLESLHRRKDGSTFPVEISRTSIVLDREYLVAVVRDISDRKRTEEAERASEERLHSFVENVSAPVAMLDRDMRYLLVSRRWMTDYRLGDRDITGLSHYEVFPDLPQSWKVIHQRCLAGAVDRCDEARLEREDGTVQWIRWEVRPWMEAGGEIGGIIMYTEDVTERKKSGDVLRASEERYRTLVAATTSIVWDSPPSGAFDSDQPAWTAFTGQTLEQHRGWGWLEAIHPADREMSAQAWAAAVKDRTIYQVEHRVRRADGEYRHMTARAVPILDPGGAVREWVGVHADITNRKRAEASLVESQKRLTLATESAGIGIWEWDVAANDLVWDARMLDLYGIRAEEFSGAFAVWQTALHPDDRDRAEAAIASALSGSKDFHTEFRIVWPDGEVRHIEAHAMVQRLGGSATRITGVNWDITDRKRAEEAVRASEERFRAFMDHSPATAFIKDEDGRFLYVNATWRRQFDPEPTDWQGKTDHDYWPRETADLFRATDLDCLARDAVLQIEETGKTPAGVEVTWLVMKFPLLENGRRGVGGMAWDITNRKRAEEALRLRDRAIRAATQGLVITDATQPENPMIYVSPGYERMTGYGADEVLGRNCRFLQGEDTDPAAVARVRGAIRASEPCTVELLNYRKDGTPFWNELSISPVRDAGGRLTNFVGVLADVTARRNLEEQFRQAQKMEAVGQLAGGIAHDFNNLLTVINGYSQMLLTELPADDPSRELIAEIHEAGERSAGLTRQLLAFSRQQVLAPRVLDLNVVVAEADKLLRRMIGEDVRLTTTLATKVWPVRADPGQIEQVMMNLAVNARDAMPTGGRLTIETRNVELDERYARTHPDARPGPHVLLSLADTGCGMPPEVAARVFQPFFTTKGVGKGTGLGLATVYGIVRQSGGHIAVYSEVGVGTTFKVYLPRTEKENGEVEERASPQPLPRGTETILLVEDEAGVRALARRVLAGCGYTVLAAADGEEATRVAAGHAGPIHLLVTDVVMPGVGGRVVAERLAASRPGVRVLFVSGYTDDAVIRHGVLREGVSFLQKPFTPATLAAKLREVLDSPATGHTTA